MARRCSSGGASRAARTAFLVAALLSPASGAQGIDVGNKLPASEGLKAGSPSAPGLYIGDRFVFYSAGRLLDRNGERVPIDIALRAWGNEFGLNWVFALPGLHTSYAVSFALPLARVHANTDRADTNVDKFGLGDAYFSPFRLGWRGKRVEAQLGYGLYVPTGKFEPGGHDGVGRGQWTHQVEFGATVYFDRAQSWHLSALAGFLANGPKRVVDITRGASLQVQGGAGKTLARIVDIGVTGYASWQVTDDRGADLPAVIRGVRDRVYSLGPELDVAIRRIRTRLTLRFQTEIGVRAGPSGQIVLAEATFKVF
jgi:hypothetical protein